MAIADAGSHDVESNSTSATREWLWHPDLPLTYPPLWEWPARPFQALKWTVSAYFPLSDRALYLLFSLITAYWLQPITHAQAVLSADWIGWVVCRNLVALLVVAGGLHCWFYVLKVQGNQGKYDPRAMGEGSTKLFRFGDQTWDNMFYSILSGVPIASAYEVGFRWLYASGQLDAITFETNMIWFVILFPLATMWQTCHFYFVHRMLHWKPLYQHVHALHHRSVNPGPWSGMSMHPIEHVAYFSSLLIFLVIPVHPTHLLFLLYWQLLGAPSGHSGYEAVRIRGVSVLKVGGFFHQLHHRHFECNYGGPEMPLDRWFGSYHEGTADSTRQTRERMRAQRRLKD